MTERNWHCLMNLVVYSVLVSSSCAFWKNCLCGGKRARSMHECQNARNMTDERCENLEWSVMCSDFNFNYWIIKVKLQLSRDIMVLIDSCLTVWLLEVRFDFIQSVPVISFGWMKMSVSIFFTNVIIMDVGSQCFNSTSTSALWPEPERSTFPARSWR